MTLSKVIENFDNERTNAVSIDTKIRWVSQLDMKIWCEILKPRSEGGFDGYNETTPLITIVKAPEEYGEIYGLYLNMKLDYQNGEIARFNNSAILFNRMFKELADYINRQNKVLNNVSVKAGKYYV